MITTSFPSHVDDAAGHFVASELGQLEGADLHVIAPRPADTTVSGVPGVTLHWIEAGRAFGWPGLASRVRQRPWRALGAAQFVQRARQVVQTLAPTRIVAHWAVPSAWPIAPAGIPLEIVSHGGDVRLLCALPRPLTAHIVADVLTRATRWRFVSQALCDQLCARLSPTLARTLTACAEIQPAHLELRCDPTLAAQLRAQVDAPLHVAVGRLVASKRVDRIVRSHRGAPGTLVVIGDGPERARLERLASELGTRALFVGQRPRAEALAWIQAADSMYFASEVEGASSVLREAAALGTKVVSI